MRDTTGISRRVFIGSLATAGAVAATPRSASAATKRPLKVSPIREGGVDEILKVTPVAIKVGDERPFRVVHASDTHLNFWDWARGQSALKAVLCGHAHVEERDRFSDTADMYVAGGNYEGYAYDITFS